MIIYLVGVGCVGKSTIGKILADEIGFEFFDFEIEVEKYYQKPIERIQAEFFTMNGYREKASVVLDYLFSKTNNLVIAGPPSGLKFYYLQVYKKYAKSRKIVSIHIKDEPENIVNRLTFYDIDSNPIEVNLDEDLKKRYLKKIRVDYNYFKDSYKRADFEVDINGMSLQEITKYIERVLKIRLDLTS